MLDRHGAATHLLAHHYLLAPCSHSFLIWSNMLVKLRVYPNHSAPFWDYNSYQKQTRSLPSRSSRWIWRGWLASQNSTNHCKSATVISGMWERSVRLYGRVWPNQNRLSSWSLLVEHWCLKHRYSREGGGFPRKGTVVQCPGQESPGAGGPAHS